MLDDREVVADEEVRKATLLLQVAEEVEHLRLDGDVKRGDGLVADDDLGVKHQGAGHVDALALTAGELVRIALEVLHVQADLAHDLEDALLAPGGIGLGAVDEHGLLDGLGRSVARVKRGIGVLEDHLDVLADRLELLPGKLGDVLATVDDLPRGGLVQLHHAAAQRGLAAAGLANDAQRLAGIDVQAHVGKGMEHLRLGEELPAAQTEVLGEVLDGENGLSARNLGSLDNSRRLRLTHGGSPRLSRACARRPASGMPQSAPAQLP